MIITRAEVDRVLASLPQETTLENGLLWCFIIAVSEEEPCRCGLSPYTDYNQCPKCMALMLISKFGRERK